ncbi:MAG: Asp-tRNA(Asn)/Glu-tRNA(Gln) amidotransferase subunit GatB [Oscillospiraceae bacterium]
MREILYKGSEPNLEYDVVIGLEVHVELSTKTKMYCGCKNIFGGRVNSNCCEICLGMPGTLPTVNKKAVEYAIKAGLAFGCTINKKTSFARKNYFYPDLPKSYQISQANFPLCVGGFVEILLDEGQKTKKISLRQIHMEEDAGKLIHDENLGLTLVDYNRAGVPLIEIVSMPELGSAQEVKAYLETIRNTLMCLGASDCRMQEGSMRCDVNVSLKPKGSETLGTRCEIKNVGSFNGAVKAVECEINRQKDILNAGGQIKQITMRWDESKNDNVIMREKESAVDYRYFEEPDLPILEIDEAEIEEIKKTIPELPSAKLARLMQDYDIIYADANLLVSNLDKCEMFESVAKLEKCTPNKVANWLLGDVSRILNEKNIELKDSKLNVQNFSEMLELIEEGKISNTAGKTVLEEIMEKDITPLEVIEKNSLVQINDEEALKAIAAEVLSVNPQISELYNKGKTNILGFAVGQCMKLSKGQGNPVIFQKIVSDLIKRG